MSDAEHSYSVDQDPHRLLTMILYVLYIVAIFSAGILAVIALIINYLKRSDVQGSIFASHFTWQIRSFWWYLFGILWPLCRSFWCSLVQMRKALPV